MNGMKVYSIKEDSDGGRDNHTTAAHGETVHSGKQLIQQAF